MTRGDIDSLIAAEVDRALARRRVDYAHDLYLEGCSDAEITARVEELKADHAVVRPYLLNSVGRNVREQLHAIICTQED